MRGTLSMWSHFWVEIGYELQSGKSRWIAAFAKSRIVGKCRSILDNSFSPFPSHPFPSLRFPHPNTVTMCNVFGCGKRMQQGNVLSDDEYGVAGPRCQGHGAVDTKCNVDGCGKYRQRTVPSDDEHGSAGPRCKPHGARRMRLPK